MKEIRGPRPAQLIGWHSSGVLHEHWAAVQKLSGHGEPLDARIVYRIADCASFLGDEAVLGKALAVIASGAAAGRPQFGYSRNNGAPERIGALIKTYRLRHAGNPHVARYVAIAASGCGVLRELHDEVAALQAEFPRDPVVAKVAATSLSLAGQKSRALQLIERLHAENQLDRALWATFDRLVVETGDRERAKEVFAAAAALHAGDLAFIIGAIRARDQVFDLEEADRIEREHLGQFPPTTDIAEFRLQRSLRTHRYQAGLDLAETCARQGIVNQATVALAAECHLALARPSQALAYIEKMESRHGVSAKDGWALLEFFIRTGDPRARDHLANLEASGNARLVPSRLFTKWKSELAVFDDTARIIARFPAARPPTGVAVVLTPGESLLHLWIGLTAAELRKNGFAVAFPYVYGRGDVGTTGDPDIDWLHGCLDFSMKRLCSEPEGIPAHRFDWTIDPGRGVVSALGLNFFQPISARIGTIMRRYRFSFDHPLARAILESHVSIADAMLAICERIRATLGRRRIPVRFLSGMTHYVPAAVLKQYCDAHARDFDMSYVAFAAGYEHYYTNLGNDRTGALSMLNMTKNPELNGPSRVHASQFESWVAGLGEADRERGRAEARSVVRFDRVRKTGNADADAVLRRIERHKSAGGRVVCLFGKILYDIWMDEPAGTVHADIVDWVNHSIAAVAGSDTLLLVKPHPNEINPLLSRPTEFFLDLVERPAGPNVILCEHKWFNVGDLLPWLDLGLLWSGTAALELQGSGIPVAMCGKWGLRDHPVPFVEIRDRAHYESLLRDPRGLRVDDAVRERCLMLLKYYSTPEVLIPYGYGNMRYLRGKDIGPPRWHMDRVEHYLEHGDPHVERMARNCL